MSEKQGDLSVECKGMSYILVIYWSTIYGDTSYYQPPRIPLIPTTCAAALAFLGKHLNQSFGGYAQTIKMPFLAVLADDFRFMGIDMFHLKLELWQYLFPVLFCTLQCLTSAGRSQVINLCMLLGSIHLHSWSIFQAAMLVYQIYHTRQKPLKNNLAVFVFSPILSGKSTHFHAHT